MEKNTFQKLAELFGFHVNEEAIETLESNQGGTHPDNWDQMSEEEKAAWMKDHMPAKTNTAQPEPKPAPAARQNQDAPDFSNLVKLNALIGELGGFDAYKSLLLSAVDAVQAVQTNEKAERETLTSAIVANSALEESDLKEMTLPILRKMAAGLAVDNSLAASGVDYRALGAGSVKTNRDDVAQMVDIFDPKTWKEG